MTKPTDARRLSELDLPAASNSRYANQDPRAHYVLFVLDLLLEAGDGAGIDMMFRAGIFDVQGWDDDHTRAVWRVILDCAPESAIINLVAAAQARDAELAEIRRLTALEATESARNRERAK